MLRGRAARRLADFESAVQCFRRVAANSPEYQSAQRQLAFVHMQTGDLELAERTFERLVQAFPDDEHSALELYWLYYNQLRTREAELVLLRRLEREPGSLTVLRHLLNLDLRAQLPRESLPYLEQIHARRPGQPAVLAAVAECRRRLGELAEAQAIIETCLTSGNSSLFTRIVAARCFRDRLDPERALQVLGPEPDPADPYADLWYELRSAIDFEQGRVEEAWAAIERALQLRPRQSGYWHQAATLSRLMGLPEAKEQLRIGIEIADARARMYEMLLAGELERPTKELCSEIARLCRLARKDQEAAAWGGLAGDAATQD